MGDLPCGGRYSLDVHGDMQQRSRSGEPLWRGWSLRATLKITKGVFCNQMKTVFSEVLEEEMVTENGDVIDAVFGQKSVDARLVSSVSIIGTTNTLLKVITQKAIDIYRGKATA